MKLTAASCTAVHFEPIELDTSRIEREIDHSSLRLAGGRNGHLREVRQLHERRRQDRGRGDGDGIHTARRIGHQAVEARVGSRIGHRRDTHVVGGEIRLKDSRRIGLRIAVVEISRGRERGAVYRLGQLRFHDVRTAGVNREPGEDQQHAQQRRHVHKREPFLSRGIGCMSRHIGALGKH